MTALLLATGPTLKQFEVGPFRNRCAVVAINDAYRVCDWADVFYACDYDWWAVHGHRVALLKGQKYTVRVNGQPTNEVAKELGNLGLSGFAAEFGALYTGHNSGFQALQLAAQLGHTDLLLAGFDMGATGSTHFFGEHPPSLSNWSDYSLFVSDFESNLDQIRKHCRVRLVTFPSALCSMFPTITPQEALRELA